MMKFSKKFIFAFMAIFIFLFLSADQSFAGSYNYTPMQKIPGFESESGDFPTYIMSIYKFAIWTVGIAAMFMITIGGFMYFGAAGNTSKLDQAKTVIKDALLGLIMVLTAFLLLYTINPDLTSINLDSLNALKIESSK